jgi:hypothetical protein
MLIGKMKGNEVICKCGGEVAVEGTMTHQVPLGFGFSRGRFQVDAARRTGFYGWCMTCNEKVFAPTGKPKRVTSRARSNSAGDIRRTFGKLKLNRGVQ